MTDKKRTVDLDNMPVTKNMLYYTLGKKLGFNQYDIYHIQYTYSNHGSKISINLII